MTLRIWRAFGWLGIVVALVMSLTPPVVNEGAHSDKIVHLTGYAVLMFWWAQIVVHRRWRLALAVVLLGIAIELLQGLTPNRQPDVFDALANTGGLLLGWLAARILPNLPSLFALLPARQR